jgi:hypothetical protein
VVDASSAFLDELDKEAEAFSTAVSREHYLNYAGLKDDLSIAPIYERHARLFERATVDRVLQAPTDDARATNLREFVVDGYLDQAAKELTEELAGRETADSIQWEGATVPYRSIHPLLINEADAARREQIDGLRREITAAQNPLREQRWDLLYSQVRDLGFADYASLCDETGALDLDGLLGTMEAFLRETEAAYHERLAPALREIGVEPAEARRSDLVRLFRSPQFDAAFPREGMLPALDKTLIDLGVDTAHQYNVHLDTDARPKKSPRAFCSAVLVPDEVYLVIDPHGGPDDYRALFHEAGHAQHFGHTRATMPFAHRGLGDNSVTEGFAFVLEHLLYSRAWHARHMPGNDQLDDYLANAWFIKLYLVRRYAAKLQYELELHRSADVRGHGETYVGRLAAALGATHSVEDYLSDLDGGFYCARYLRAWMFDAQVRAWFVGKWGDAWFADAEAAAALRELWSDGQRRRAEEILRSLGYDGLDIRPLTEELLAN